MFWTEHFERSRQQFLPQSDGLLGVPRHREGELAGRRVQQCLGVIGTQHLDMHFVGLGRQFECLVVSSNLPIGTRKRPQQLERIGMFGLSI